jgi:GTP-binding protein
VNKWDLVERDSKTMQKWTDDIRGYYKYLDNAPIVILSQKENKRVQTLFPAINEAYEAYHRRIQTSVFNDVIIDAV